jgi:hypothetical protein
LIIHLHILKTKASHWMRAVRECIDRAWWIFISKRYKQPHIQHYDLPNVSLVSIQRPTPCN